MPYSDELNRQYTITEARYWRELRHAVLSSPEYVSPYEVAQMFGIDKQRMLQHLRTWENDGLIIFHQGHLYMVNITGFGRRFTFEESYSDLEG